MLRSDVIAEMFWLNMDKDHSHQIWTKETTRNFSSVETVKLYIYYIIHNNQQNFTVK